VQDIEDALKGGGNATGESRIDPGGSTDDGGGSGAAQVVAMLPNHSIGRALETGELGSIGLTTCGDSVGGAEDINISMTSGRRDLLVTSSIESLAPTTPGRPRGRLGHKAFL